MEARNKQKHSLDLVEKSALEKAKNAYNELKEIYTREKGTANLETFNPLILSCDTVVVIDDIVLGKPKDREDAIRIFKKLIKVEL